MRDETSSSQGEVLGVDGDDSEGDIHVVVALLVVTDMVQVEVARIRSETYVK